MGGGWRGAGGGGGCAGAPCAGGYSATLLKGVTGSGKTEVYLEAVAECLRSGRQALGLAAGDRADGGVPDAGRGAVRGAAGGVAFGVTMTERRRVWKMAARGAGLVVGARSALFLPFQDLGLIVVDEEHDTSYKQEEGVLYHARDMAVLRAAMWGAPVVLASATPSLESWANVEAGKYQRLDLGAASGRRNCRRCGRSTCGRRRLPGDRWISPTLAAKVDAVVARGEQALLFLNRRGFAPVTLCRACGHQVGCDHCDARMVEHRFQKRLVCHQCGATKPVPLACPACGVEGRMAPSGRGWSGWRRRWRRGSRRRGWRCCRRTCSGRRAR
jgi:primosomal protein N' (replication factor Y) (superfamily II helicase)